MKSILRQMLEGTRFLHERGILHRDLKPSNVIVSQPPTVPSNADTTNAEAPPGKPNSRGGIEGGDNHGASLNSETTPVAPWVGRRWGHGNPSHSSSPSHGTRKRRRGRGAAWRMGGGEGNNHGPSPVLLKVADFSSAVDEGAMAAGLYGAAGPAQAEETLQYAPPEVLFDPEVRASPRQPVSLRSCSSAGMGCMCTFIFSRVVDRTATDSQSRTKLYSALAPPCLSKRYG